MAGTADGIRNLLDIGEALVSELDPEIVLERILAEAQRLTGAEFVALGVLDEERHELDRFLTAGIDGATRREIGALPRGRGVLGVLIDDPRPLRLDDVGEHPESYGFPPGHPQMSTFLGVPIVIGGQVWGNLYLTEKQGGEPFTQEDEDAAIELARWAAVAIENARVHQRSEQDRERLGRAVRTLEASRAITDAVGGVADLERVLELIVKRGRALVGARTLLILLKEGDELVVAACAGHADTSLGRRLPIEHSTSGEVLESGRPERIRNVKDNLRISPESFGVSDASTALIAPMLHRGVGIGVLVAFDHGDDRDAFDEEGERLLRAFAQSAANAVAIKRSVEADRLRSTIAAAESERARWSRELHDQTLQALGALRVMLASSLSRGDASSREEAMRQAVTDIEQEIANLREIISDLRPSLLDDLGLIPALEALLERRRSDSLAIDGELSALAPLGLSPELETTVYRVVQESLTNVVKHSGASRVRVCFTQEAEELVVEVRDDGRGFDRASPAAGFGLAGMRERVTLVGGSIEVRPAPNGTTVHARLPVRVNALDWSEEEPLPVSKAG